MTSLLSKNYFPLLICIYTFIYYNISLINLQEFINLKDFTDSGYYKYWCGHQCPN